MSRCVSCCSIYSSDDDEEDVEMYDHDYDGLLPKAGKRHLGKTRWTREEVIAGLVISCMGEVRGRSVGPTSVAALSIKLVSTH